MPLDGRSSVLLNQVLLDYDKFIEIQGISTSVFEFSIGRSIQNTNFDLNFGFLKTDPTMISQVGHEFIMSPGVYNDQNRKPKYYSDNNNTFKVQINQQLGISSNIIQNCYAFGSIFLTLRTTGVSVEPIVYKGSIGTSSESAMPIYMCKNDIDISTMYNYLLMDNFVNVTPPSLYLSGTLIESVKLHDFILDIDYFKNTSDYKMQAITIDKRHIRAWGGFAEEKLSTSFIPSLVDYKKNVFNKTKQVETSIKTLISSWINDLNWQPSFYEYWASINPTMPSRLKIYIKDEFNILIP